MLFRNFVCKLRQLDAYPKTLDDFRVKTYSGATVTVVSAVVISILFLSELNYFLTKEIHPELFVDTTSGQKLQIYFNITFPDIDCAHLSIDTMDVSGDQQLAVEQSIQKQTITPSGEILLDGESGHEDSNLTKEDGSELPTTTLDPNRCESCYGAETSLKKCCNTCDDVKEAYRRRGWVLDNVSSVEQCLREVIASIGQNDSTGAGCHIAGQLDVNKVAGHFHFAPGKSFQQRNIHVHDLQYSGGQKFNTSHKFNQLSFGEKFPGRINPLDGLEQIDNEGSTQFQYFVKIVPTTYVKLSGDVLLTNQFSVTKHRGQGPSLGSQGLPGVFFTYEFSPMIVKYTEKRRSFMHFLTSVCAIVGGVFTVSGLVDSFIYRSTRAIQHKIELGKTS